MDGWMDGWMIFIVEVPVGEGAGYVLTWTFACLAAAGRGAPALS